ncbi:MAG: 3-isopropylmalate dehydratase large subunit [Desulfovibrionaceae bacterium]|jgi:3-isopropylmalate/(R)-2-methylmalate dehydratase large subunit|nr:3-isopropylmalate dehydratase large subunit [Desulfovibrionaceae bacterium]
MKHTLAEKLLLANLVDAKDGAGIAPGRIVRCFVSMTLAEDLTAPLGIKAFREMGANRVFDRDKVALICDHFTPNKDVASAEQVKSIREFAKQMGITHYFEGGNCGVEHVILPELGLVGPGDLVIGADSHTCTYGALCAFATGVGSTDFAAAMVLGETWFKVPESCKVEFTGRLAPHLGGKDLILETLRRLGVSGALYMALEFCGEPIDALDVEQRMTMANMAVEGGAKVGLFASDRKTVEYAKAHGRNTAWEIHPDPDAAYAQTLRIDVSDMSPRVARPHLPDNVVGVEELADVRVDQVFLGSCTNGRISDLRVAAELLRGRKVADGVRFMVLPGSARIYGQAMREGLLEVFLQAGAVIGPPSCGPCVGGHLGILASGEKCLSTSNRNFRGRMGSLRSEVYLAGPAVAAATAVTGRITHPADL